MLPLFIILFYLQPTSSIYFLLKPSIQKCVLDDVPKNQLVVVHYELIDVASQAEVIIETYDSKMNVFQTRVTKGGKEKVSFTPAIGGQHRICMTYINRAGAGTSDAVRFSIRMNVGEEELRKDDAVKTDFISQIYGETINLKEKTQRYINTQEHNRGNEDSLYEENTIINDRLVLATIFQTIIIIASGIFQILSLRQFFINRKLY